MKFELTNAQQNILEVEKSLLTSDNLCNVLVVSIRFNSDLDDLKLEKTINKIIELNDSFRIKFDRTEDVIKQFIENYTYKKFEKIKIDNNQQFIEFIDKFKEQPIDINKNLYDFKIVTFNKNKYILYKVHHIINDAWGMTQVAEQIKEIYPIIENEKLLSTMSKPSFLHAIKNEENYKKSERYEKDRMFWNEYIKELSTDKTFNKDISDNIADRVCKNVSKETRKKILEYCKENKITEYTFFLAIISIYFFKIYNKQNINIGTPFLNRNKKELENVGLFVTNLPLNITLEIDKTFLELCNEIYSNNYKLFKHSMFPYLEIQKMFSKINSSSSLFEIGFSYQINTLKNKLGEDLGETNWYFSNRQTNPITIHLSNMNSELEIYYDYIESIFNKTEIENIHNIIIQIANSVIEQKDIKIKEIGILTEKEKRKLSLFNNTGKAKITNTTISEILDEICQKYAKNTAIKYKETEITYSDFYKKVCELANILRENNVKRNIPVALFFDKSIEMIISMFAVIKAGGYYIPILPQESKERIEYILNDSNPICVLTIDKYADKLEKQNVIIVDSVQLGLKEYVVNNINNKNDLIYVIYTSGSTGKPKGTKIMHKNIQGLMYSISNDDVIKATANDVSMSLLKYSFDASGIDIYTSLLNGGKLLLISPEDELNPNKVVEIMQKEKVTRSFLVPKWLEHINNADAEMKADLSALRILGAGGETFKPKQVKRLYEKYVDLKLLNLYGPTETTMFATYSIIDQESIEKNYISIGKPIKYSRALVINNFGDILPTNTKGELVLYEDKNSITNIAAGYLNLKDITESRFCFIRNTIDNNENIRIYKTGDIVIINDNLQIEYLGRTDDVVKVNNGYLVALNEVEAMINKVIGDKYQFNVVDINTNITKSLILFIKTNNNIDKDVLKKHVNTNLPFYMRIKEIFEIEDFPRNNSGKVNRKELKRIAEEQIIKRKIIMPRNKTEKMIYGVIKKQCNLEYFSITDDFIDDLGIDSLNMTVIYSLLNIDNLKMQDLYTYTSIEDLANFINNKDKKDKDIIIKDVPIINNVTRFKLKNVLFTGATGFLGIHILRELLNNDNVKKVYCIVRNKENISSKERLYKKINFYFNIDERMQRKLKSKLVILDGDISKKQFGLSDQVYNELSQKIDTVINSAANVKHYGKYKEFLNSNVKSVQNILEFCKDNISLAHISTLSIAGFKNEETEDRVYDEQTLYIKQEFNNNPYLITKFKAEQLILESNTNSKIFRLGNIMPRRIDGIFQENYNQNAFLSAIRLVLKLNKIPKEYLDFKLEFSPVDKCAEGIIKIIENDCNNKIYHIVNDNEITVREILEFLDVDIDKIGKMEFLKELNNYDEIGSEYIKEYILQNNLNHYSVKRTNKILNECGFKWDKIDKKYIHNLIKIIQSNRW